MENLVGFVIFLVIIVVSIINKIRTEGQESQQPLDRPISRDDIPEATRRMLYGDGSDIMVAKPRTAASEHHRTPGPPHPVGARQVEVDGEGPRPRPVPPVPPRPQPRPAPTMQTRPMPVRQAPAAVHAKPVPQPVRREMPQPQSHLRPQSHPQTARRPVIIEEKEGPTKTVAPTPQRKPQARPATVQARSGGTSLTAMLACKEGLSRGILLREILGPPRALEDYI